MPPLEFGHYLRRESVIMLSLEAQTKGIWERKWLKRERRERVERKLDRQNKRPLKQRALFERIASQL